MTHAASHSSAEQLACPALDDSGTTAQPSGAVRIMAKWQVKFPSGWQDLPPEASCKTEAARNDGKHVVEYEQCRSKKQDWWDPYRIVFSTMQQTNLRSGTVRETRRLVTSAGAPELAKLPTLLFEPARGGVWKEPSDDEE